MKLSDHEQAMLVGEDGPVRKWAMEHMVQVGGMFDADDTVVISQVHMMADPESLGVAGVEFLENLACHAPEERCVRVPMITDPRGVDLDYYRPLGQTEEMADLERRLIARDSLVVPPQAIVGVPYVANRHTQDTFSQLLISNGLATGPAFFEVCEGRGGITSEE